MTKDKPFTVKRCGKALREKIYDWTDTYGFYPAHKTQTAIFMTIIAGIFAVFLSISFIQQVFLK